MLQIPTEITEMPIEVPLPETEFFYLRDVFTIELCKKTEELIVLILKLIFFPPNTYGATPETSVLLELLKDLREELYSRLARLEPKRKPEAVDQNCKHFLYSDCWVFGPFESEWHKLLPQKEVKSFLTELVTLLKELQANYIDAFCHCAWWRDIHGADWLQKATINGKVVEYIREEERNDVFSG